MKKRRVLLRKLGMGVLSILTAAACAGGFWMWKTSFISHTRDAVVDGFYQMTARNGFALQALYLEGRNRTPMDEITQALGIKKGSPILQLDIDEARQRLERIGSISMAAVERELPGTLHVRIIEREPVALWQHEGQLALVDDQGVAMNDIDSGPYQNLPLMVGENAPLHVAELMQIIGSDARLAQQFAAAIRVGDRRWNIRLKNGMEIKLPETDPANAWKRLAELDGKERLLDRDIKVIDLRVEGRLFIKLSPQDVTSKAAGAKET